MPVAWERIKETLRGRVRISETKERAIAETLKGLAKILEIKEKNTVEI
jgi:hypothetical protein